MTIGDGKKIGLKVVEGDKMKQGKADETARKLQNLYQDRGFMITFALAAAASGVAFLFFSREIGWSGLKAGIFAAIIFIMVTGEFCTVKSIKKMKGKKKDHVS